MEVTTTLETTNLKKTEKQTEIDKMRDALRSIACEMQRFQKPQSDPSALSFVSPDSPDCSENEKVLSELLKSKTKVNSKRDRINKLRKNLKTACFVAKTVASAKEDESGSLKQRLSFVRSECTDLLEKYKDNNKIINSLSKENGMLYNKLENVANFIRLGYRELQKLRQEPSEETSILVQLKKLIDCCGKYYADYCNEHDKCLQLKQRNRFLINKIQILDSNVKALLEQRKPLKYRKVRSQKENDLVNDGCTKSKHFNNIEVAYSEVKTKTSVKESILNIDAANEIKCKRNCNNSQYKLDSEHNFDLSPHLLIVEKLLRDQDRLLRDLKGLSQKFLSTGDEFSY